MRNGAACVSLAGRAVCTWSSPTYEHTAAVAIASNTVIYRALRKLQPGLATYTGWQNCSAHGVVRVAPGCTWACKPVHRYVYIRTLYIPTYLPTRGRALPGVWGGSWKGGGRRGGEREGVQSRGVERATCNIDPQAERPSSAACVRGMFHNCRWALKRKHRLSCVYHFYHHRRRSSGVLFPLFYFATNRPMRRRAEGCAIHRVVAIGLVRSAALTRKASKSRQLSMYSHSFVPLSSARPCRSISRIVRSFAVRYALFVEFFPRKMIIAHGSGTFPFFKYRKPSVIDK